jgi:hypothetical protein
MSDGSSRSLPLYLLGHGASAPYTRPSGGGSGDADPPARNRAEHAAALRQALTSALVQADAVRALPDAAAAGGTPGFYLEFELPRQQVGVVDKLEKRGRGQQIELVAVISSNENAERVTATVFVPDAQRDYYLRKIEAYRTEETPSGKPKNAPLVAAIEAVRLAAVRSLFTDSADLFPAPGQPVWWEL